MINANKDLSLHSSLLKHCSLSVGERMQKIQLDLLTT